MSEPRKSYELADRNSSSDSDEAYGYVSEVIATHKSDLTHARIGIAWMVNRTEDIDGRRKLGKMRLLNELDRLMLNLDAIILLDRGAWAVMKPPQRLALVHHELCHLAPVEDEDGSQKADGHGERKWRTVKHDIEEFREVVAAHGCYKERSSRVR